MTGELSDDVASRPAVRVGGALPAPPRVADRDRGVVLVSRHLPDHNNNSLGECVLSGVISLV